MNFVSIKRFFFSALFEYSVALLVLLYLLLYSSLGLPSVPELVLVAEKGFQNYGFFFLFFGLLLEGLFVVGLYFPGSIIAFSAVIFLGKTPLDVLLVVIVGTFTLLVASVINYGLGKYGYYKLFKKIGAEETLERMKNRFIKNYRGTVFLFSSSPNFLGIASVYAGISRVSLRKYLAYISLCVFFWISVVSTILFLAFSKETLSEGNGIGWIAFVVLLAWALFESISFTRAQNKLKEVAQ